MTDLERFAAVLLAECQQEGRRRTDPLAVGSLLDRILPYRTARKSLGIDASEDYEMLVLRLIAEEGALVHTEPGEAAALARETVAATVPDLDILQRLRSASLAFTDDAVDRLEGVRPMPTPPPNARGGRAGRARGGCPAHHLPDPPRRRPGRCHRGRAPPRAGGAATGLPHRSGFHAARPGVLELRGGVAERARGEVLRRVRRRPAPARVHRVRHHVGARVAILPGVRRHRGVSGSGGPRQPSGASALARFPR